MESRAKLQATLMMLGNNTSPAAGASELPVWCSSSTEICQSQTS